MAKSTNENDVEIKEKLDTIGLDLKKVPKYLTEIEPIQYRVIKKYEQTSEKVYRYINVKDIDILITQSDRLDEMSLKYKKAKPLADYIEKKGEENLEEHDIFIRMLKDLDLERLKDLEKQQESFKENIPYEVKYKDNFVWQIFYAEASNRYFMLFPSNETRTESLFYLIKKKIEARKSRKKELIFVPICDQEYHNAFFKRTQIADLENYLWLFTGNWPTVYEVYDKKDEMSLQIVGETTTYDKIKSLYKIVLQDKMQAQEYYKLVKALFILQTYDEQAYHFKVEIGREGDLEFSMGYSMQKLNYNTLPSFIQKESTHMYREVENLTDKLVFESETLELLKQTIEKQTEEYKIKEKQIVTFLECKKTFFGKVKYFFGSKKSKKTEEEKIKEIMGTKPKKEEKEELTLEELPILKRENTIEDLLKLCDIFKERETLYKNIEMDIKAAENKKKNLESKIKNATLYINEIESHKKSIFDFWKFTNKDQVTLLNESEQQDKEESKKKIKKVFDYEEDFEDVGKQIDDRQRTALSQNECDGIFAIEQELPAFQMIEKAKLLKRDKEALQKRLEQLQEQYVAEGIGEKGFDIFGNVLEDKTKIKSLKNNKHREIQKDIYKILGITPQTTLEEYKTTLMNYDKLVKEAYGKIVSPIDMCIYQASNQELQGKGLDIFYISPQEAIKDYKTEEKAIIFNKVNLREGMPAIFYTNSMYYDNMHKTLPVGMDVSSKVLLDLNEFSIKLVSRKDFRVNSLKNEVENEIKNIQVFEYQLEIKRK